MQAAEAWISAGACRSHMIAPVHAITTQPVATTAPGHQGHRDAYRAEVVFEEQRSKGIGVWREPFSKMRVPKLYNLRSDPFEAGDDAILYDQWTVDHVFYPGTHTGTRGQMAGDFQGLSAPSQTRKLQRRPDN